MNKKQILILIAIVIAVLVLGYFMLGASSQEQAAPDSVADTTQSETSSENTIEPTAEDAAVDPESLEEDTITPVNLPEGPAPNPDGSAPV